LSVSGFAATSSTLVSGGLAAVSLTYRRNAFPSDRVTEEMNEEIEELAKKEQRPVSNLLRVLIAEALHYRKLGIGPNEFEEFMKSRKK